MRYAASLFLLVVFSGLSTAQTPRAPGLVLGGGYSAPAPLKVAPGQVLTIFVHSPDGIQPEQAFTAEGIPLPATLGGFAVQMEQTFGGTSDVPLFAVYPVNSCSGLSPSACTKLTAITLQIPWELTTNSNRAGRPENFAVLRVSYQGVAGDAYAIQPETDRIHIINVCDSTMPPGFERTGDFAGGCRALVTHLDGRLVTAGNPATAGETVVMYAFGLGHPGVMVRNGDTVRDAVELSSVSIQFQAGINLGAVRPAAESNPALLFAGLATGQVGLYQITFTVPAVPEGTEACTASTIASNLTVSVSRAQSFDGVGICVKP